MKDASLTNPNLRIKADLIRKSILMNETMTAFRLKLDEDYHNHMIKCIESGLIGISKYIDSLGISIELAASDNFPVLILGETGTGKEIVTKAIHDQMSTQMGLKKLESINCAGIPETLLESELFGHLKGSYTGATEDKKGLVEIADRGTLFLDEIGDMPPFLQSKILRFLNDGTYRKLGSTEEKTSKVRIIAATNRNLDDRDVRGKVNFREDLYWRINALTITLEPLRVHPEDLPLLIYINFNQLILGENGNSAVSTPNFLARIHSQSLLKLLCYNYPGNYRELNNLLHVGFAHAKTGTELDVFKTFDPEYKQLMKNNPKSMLIHYLELPQNILNDEHDFKLTELTEDLKWGDYLSIDKLFGINVRKVQKLLSEKLGLSNYESLVQGKQKFPESVSETPKEFSIDSIAETFLDRQIGLDEFNNVYLKKVLNYIKKFKERDRSKFLIRLLGYSRTTAIEILRKNKLHK